MDFSGNTAMAVTIETTNCSEVGSSKVEITSEAININDVASNNINVLYDTANLNKVQNNTDNNEALNEMSQSNGNIHELSTEAQTNTDNEKNECLNNESQAYTDTEDLIRMGLPSDSLEPQEVNIRYAIQRDEIHPENIPSYARKCPDWNFLGRDSYYSMKKERQPLEKCLPIKNRYSFSERLNLQLTTENRLCVIVLVGAVDTHTKRIKPKAIEILSSFPPNSFTAYYSIGGQDIEILCRYSKEIGIEHQEFGNIFEGIHAVKILSAGDFWETRGYLYDTEFFGLIESPAVDIALKKFQHRCAELKEEKRLYDEKINRMAAELATRSREIQEAEDARQLAAKTATANMTHAEAATSDTATTDTASSKPTVEATNDVSGLDFSDFFTPYESDTTNGEQTPSAAQESKSPDMTETDIVTELLPVNAETVTSEKSSDTVQVEEATLNQLNAVTETVPIVDNEYSCSEIPDTDSPVDPNIPILTEADLIPKDDRTPEEILREYGFIDAEPVPEKLYTEVTSSPSIVRRLTDDLPVSPYEWLSLEGMVHENTFVPEVLKNMKIWIGRCGKKPWSPNGRYPIGPKDTKECVTYDEAIAAAEKYGYDGVSIMLMESNDIWCVDIDDCNKDGKIHPVAWSIIKKLNSWTELSTNGSGFHIYILADKKDRLDWNTNKKNALGAGIDLEIYPNKRHIVSTRRTLKGFEQLRRADKELEEIYNAYMAPKYKKFDNATVSEPPPTCTADELMQLLKKDRAGAPHVLALTTGDTSGFENQNRSCVLWAILCKMCFYCVQPDVIKELLMNSQLDKTKWTRMTGNEPYIDYEIRKALMNVKQHYHPSKKKQQDNQKQKPLSLQNYLDDFSFDFQTLANVELNAIALSEFFGKTIKDVVCYSAFNKTFYIYNGIIWDSSQQETVMATIAKRFIKYCLSLCSLKIKTLESEIKSGNDDDEKNAEKKAELEKAHTLYNYYKSQSSFGARSKLIADVKNEIAVDHEQFDRDPYLLNLQNGTFNLNTFELQPHRSSDMLTMVAAASYDPNAECPRFLQFIDEVTLNRTEIKRYLQKACGYLLSGKNESHCMFFFYGKKTRNGKTTLASTIKGTLSTYSVACDVDIITKPSGKGSGSPKPELLQLYKKRFAYFEEPDKYSTLQASLIKQITGGSELSARGLYSNSHLEFKCAAKMVISCNSLPRINDLSQIKSDRIKIIPFDKHFSENERDTSLADQFSTPEAMSAILNWMIEGYKMYVSEGLKPFKEMESLLNTYEQGYDIYRQFIEENLRLCKDNNRSEQMDVTVKAVWEAGKKWLKENNYNIPTRRDFVFELQRAGVTLYRKNNQDYIKGFILDFEGSFNTEYKDAAEVRRKNSNDSWHKPPRM